MCAAPVPEEPELEETLAQWNEKPSEAPPPLDIFALPEVLLRAIARLPWLELPVRFTWRLGERWGIDRCGWMAGAMAFFGLLSLFPLLLAGITILGAALKGRPDQVQEFVEFASRFFPGSTARIWQERVQGEISGLSQASSGWLGVVSLASLLWSGRAFFDALAAVLNTIWPRATLRSWIAHQVALWSTFVGAALLYAASLSASFALGAARSLSERLPDGFWNQRPVLWEAAGQTTAWLLTLGMFWTIYWFLPNARDTTRKRHALLAAVVATTLLEAAKYGFSWYLPDTTRYGAVYGSVAGVIMTMMWLYISSSIILLGAEVAAVWIELEARAKNLPQPTRERADDPQEALHKPL
jgi:membrane protein